MICFSPISTSKFIKEKLPQINGLGGKMVSKLLESKNYEHFQEMSLEFAKYVRCNDTKNAIKLLMNYLKIILNVELHYLVKQFFQ